MRADATHRVERHRPADHLVMHIAVDIGPPAGQLDGFVERHMRHLAREAADLFGGNPALGGNGVGRVVGATVAVEDEGEDGTDSLAPLPPRGGGVGGEGAGRIVVSR